MVIDFQSTDTDSCHDRIVDRLIMHKGLSVAILNAYSRLYGIDAHAVALDIILWSHWRPVEVWA